MAMLLDVSRPVAAHVAGRVARQVWGGTEGSGAAVRLGYGVAEYPRDGRTSWSVIAAAEKALRSSLDAGGLLAAEDGGLAAAARGARGGVPGGAEWRGALAGFLTRARRRRAPVSLLAVDIEHLRRYKERYGGEACDAVVRSVTYFIGQNVRRHDLAGVGEGGGFFVAMDCGPEQAQLAGQRLAEGARKIVIHAGGVSLKISLSGGVADLGSSGQDAEALVRNALAALEEAKAHSPGTCVRHDGRERT